MSLAELTFDLNTKDGVRLEETVLHLLQRGAAGFQAVVRAAGEGAPGGRDGAERVRRVVLKASDRVIEGVGEAPLKARQGPLSAGILALVDPAAIERKGYEFLARGRADLASLMASALASQHSRPSSAIRLKAAGTLAEGRLSDALALLGSPGDELSPEDGALRGLLLAQGGRFEEAVDALVRVVSTPGLLGGDRDPVGEALVEAVLAISELVLPGDPGGVGAACVDRLVEKNRPLATVLFSRAADELLKAAEREGAAARQVIIARLDALDRGASAIAERLRGKLDGSPHDDRDLIEAASEAAAMGEEAEALGLTVLPYLTPSAGPVDLGAMVGADSLTAWGDAAMTGAALAPIIREVAEGSAALESVGGGVGVSGPSVAPGPANPRLAGVIFTGHADVFRPPLTWLGGGRPVGPARAFRTARAALEAQGGGVVWRLGKVEEGRPDEWTLWVGLPAATPDDGDGTEDAGPLNIQTILGVAGPGRPFLAAVRRSSAEASRRAMGEGARLIDGVRAAAQKTAAELRSALDQARRGHPDQGGLDGMSRSIEEARWWVRTLRTYLGFTGVPAPVHDELNAVVSQAIHLGRLGLPGGTPVSFLPGSGLPRLNLDRERLAAAIVGLCLEMGGRGSGQGEVRLTTIHLAEEAAVRLVVSGPVRPESDGLPLALAGRVMGEVGGALAVDGGGGQASVILDFVVSETDRRLLRDFPDYLRLGAETRKAVKTAEAVLGGATGVDPGLRPFLWRKAVELELAAAARTRLQRHLFLAKAIDSTEGGKNRLSRLGEARLARLTAALPGEDASALRARLLSVVGEVTGDRFDRVLGDLRSLAVLLLAFADDGGPGTPVGLRSDWGVLARRLYALGGQAPDSPGTVDLCREVLAGLVAMKDG